MTLVARPGVTGGEVSHFMCAQILFGFLADVGEAANEPGVYRLQSVVPGRVVGCLATNTLLDKSFSGLPSKLSAVAGPLYLRVCKLSSICKGFGGLLIQVRGVRGVAGRHNRQTWHLLMDQECRG